MNSKKTIVIVDYGLGNLYSIGKALKNFNVDFLISNDVDEILSADGLILPGVGAFAAGMDGLNKVNLIKILNKFVESGRPVMGICLGAQLLFSNGFEFGKFAGLDIIPGEVKIFPEEVKLTEKIPHIGWNEIYSIGEHWGNTILNDIDQMSNVYFVHSFVMMPDNKNQALAVAKYGNFEFCAVTKKGNIYGVQFHPEKSGTVGLKIIENFIKLI